jgi:hypothetical protein
VPLEILWTAIPAIVVLGISVYSFDVYDAIGGFSPHAVHEAPITPQAVKMPGAAIAATLSDSPLAQAKILISTSRNLTRQCKTPLQHQSGMLTKFLKSEMLQA